MLINSGSENSKGLREFVSIVCKRDKSAETVRNYLNTIGNFSYHTGAIEIFKRTGSITKLQKAMGHSSINVSLTYLRGLEIPELNEEDMPMINNF